jgi:hypothetical protein
MGSVVGAQATKIRLSRTTKLKTVLFLIFASLLSP